MPERRLTLSAMMASVVKSWQFILVMGAIVGSATMAALRVAVIEADHVAMTDQLVQQSEMDSVLSLRSWLNFVGVKYIVCKQQNPDNCDTMLRFAPELRNEDIPLPPAVRVWRPDTSHRR